MARISEMQQYNLLKGLIEEAVADAIQDNGGNWDDGGITVAISPDLSEVVAGFVPWWELGDCDGWNIETAATEEEAYEIVNMYFDLRKC